MRLGRWFGVPVRVNPVTLPMMALAFWLGEGRRLGMMLISILLHEFSHIAAARLLHVRVLELELMPAGGAARLENLWRLRPGQTTAVALAGPLCNLLLMTLSAALCWWGILPPDWAAALIEQNAVIFLFNLLPALPMDGGRVLCGLLSRRLSRSAAARVGAWTARGMAAILLAVAMIGFLRGHMNITLPIAAVFLLMCGGREQRQAEGAALESMMGRAEEMEEEVVLPVRWLAAGLDTPVRDVAVRMKPRYMHMIALYDDQLRLVGILSEAALTGALIDGGEERVGNLKPIGYLKESLKIP